MKLSEATYFDGVTSKGNQVLVKVDKAKNALVLETFIKSRIIWSLKESRVDFNGEEVEIWKGDNSGEFVKIADAGFIDELRYYLKKTGQLNVYQRFMKINSRWIAAIALGLMSIIILAYFFVLPWVAERAVVLVPTSFDDRIGNEVQSQLVDNVQIDTLKTKYLNQFASELKLHNEKPLNFFVMKSEEENAFALPNGTIVVYSSLIDKMGNYSELAGLIGHEVSHVNGRHSMKTIFRNLAGYLFISVVFSDINGIMTVVAENVEDFQNLSYSRKFEEQADEEGLKMLVENKIDPQGMVRLFERLKEDEATKLPEIFRTHPLTENRIENINEIMSSQSIRYEQNMKLKELFEMLNPEQE